jgi:hypothetical protein
MDAVHPSREWNSVSRQAGRASSSCACWPTPDKSEGESEVDVTLGTGVPFLLFFLLHSSLYTCQYTFNGIYTVCQHDTSIPLLLSLHGSMCSDADAPCHRSSIWQLASAWPQLGFGALLAASRSPLRPRQRRQRQGHQIWQRQRGGRCVNSLMYT